MEGCVICGLSIPGRDDRELNEKIVKAKLYAQENKIAVAVCKEGTEFSFYSAEYAISNGYNIVTVVSQYQ